MSERISSSSSQNFLLDADGGDDSDLIKVICLTPTSKVDRVLCKIRQMGWNMEPAKESYANTMYHPIPGHQNVIKWLDFLSQKSFEISEFSIVHEIIH